MNLPATIYAVSLLYQDGRNSNLLHSSPVSGVEPLTGDEAIARARKRVEGDAGHDGKFWIFNLATVSSVVAK